MKLYTLNTVGQLHKTHTEDHIFHSDLNQNWFIGAVMDGCSSGKESHFASNLLGKIIRKACNSIPNLERISPDLKSKQLEHELIGKHILHVVFDDLKKTKQLLSLELKEMLTTLILMVFQKDNRSAWINISGDGLIANNMEIIEIDQENVPDYMSYHLDIDFEKWFMDYSKTFTFEQLENLSISTDGVSKFYTPTERRQKNIDPEKFLLTDLTLLEDPDMLEKKCKVLYDEHGLVPFDDLGIIRLIPS